MSDVNAQTSSYFKNIMNTQNTLYRVKQGYMVEDIAGKYVLMAPAVGDIDYSKMLVLSESAAFVVNNIINESQSFDSLLMLLLSEYNVDKEIVKGELTNLIADLEKLNVFDK